MGCVYIKIYETSQMKYICIFVKLVKALCFYSVKFICIIWSYSLISFPLAKYCALIKTNEIQKTSLRLLLNELDVMKNIPFPDRNILGDQYGYFYIWFDIGKNIV